MSPNTISLNPHSETTKMAGEPVLHVPFSVPTTDSYYWTAHWQRGERQADADLRSGDFQDFDSASDAIRWLKDES